MQFDIEQLRLKKTLKKTTNFNLLLLGPKGIGKKTFFTKLWNDKDVLNQEQFSYLNYSKHPIKFVNDDAHFFDHLNFPMEDVNNHSIINFKSYILNTGDKIDNSQTGDIIKHYIEDKFNELLLDEGKIQRSKRQYEQNDNRIHLCIYFIDGNQGKLNEIDLDILNKIKNCTNIMYVIGKADKYSRSDWVKLQNRIKSQICSNNLCSFEFGNTTLQDIFINNETQNNNNIFPYLVDESQPFPIICGNAKETSPQNENLIHWKRKYNDREIYIENYQTSFFIFVKGIILGSHLQEFKDTTDEVIYERYRTEKLLQRAEENANGRDIDGGQNSITYKQSINKFASKSNNAYLFDSYIIKEKNQIIEAYEKRLQYMEKIMKRNEAIVD